MLIKQYLSQVRDIQMTDWGLSDAYLAWNYVAFG